MEIRKSRVLRQLRAGKVVTCVKLNLESVRNVELAAMCGFDSVWIDMEHTPGDYSFVENTVRAAKNYDCDVVTRAAKGCYSDYIRPLEADSAAIMIPHLMSLKEAEEIVYYTKFHPVGRRPIDGGNADGKFCLVDADEYIKQTNEERFVIVQIEDPEPLAELEQICALPGIDMIFFGPADFAQGIGTPNDFANPKITEARERIAKTARKHGKFAGTVGSVGNQDILIGMGYNFIALGADVIGLANYYKDIVVKCKDKEF